jgi:hypothetical protein
VYEDVTEAEAEGTADIVALEEELGDPLREGSGVLVVTAE